MADINFNPQPKLPRKPFIKKTSPSLLEKVQQFIEKPALKKSKTDTHIEKSTPTIDPNIEAPYSDSLLMRKHGKYMRKQQQQDILEQQQLSDLIDKYPGEITADVIHELAAKIKAQRAPQEN